MTLEVAGQRQLPQYRGERGLQVPPSPATCLPMRMARHAALGGIPSQVCHEKGTGQLVGSWTVHATQWGLLILPGHACSSAGKPAMQCQWHAGSTSHAHAVPCPLAMPAAQHPDHAACPPAHRTCHPCC